MARRPLIIPLAALLAAPIFFRPGPARCEKRTLTRTEDYVILTGPLLDGVKGADVRALRLYSCYNGCRQVPVQVDKVDAMGRYVFPQDANRERDGDLLDPNDEVSFMASDAGDRGPPGLHPPGAVRVMEIELRDPLDNGAAWAYLCEVPGSAPDPSLPDYVSYHAGDEIVISSPQFALGYKKGGMSYDLLRARGAGGNLSPDLLKIQRMGIEALLTGGKNLPLSVPESIMETHDIAVIDGPVRVIVDEVVKVRMGAVSFQWGSEMFINFFRCGEMNPVTFKFPAAVNAIFKTLTFYYSLDFTPGIGDYFYLDPAHSAPLLIGTDERDGVPDDQPHYWWGFYGPGGAMLHVLDLGADARHDFICDGRWKSDHQARAKNDSGPGRLEIGFTCHERENLSENQEYTWDAYLLFPASPTAAGLTALADIFEHPLVVKAGPMP